ncbi:MAG: hypothetical protein ACTSR8_14460 [Promethearchaeota archaeon]
MKPKELFEQWSSKEQKLQLLELVLFISCATFFFWYFNTNMLMFGVFVYIGLGWLIYKTPNRKLSLITGIIGGLIGFLTEAWGCSTHLWNWTEPIITLWMILGHYNGFPVEVVIAYFASGFWIGKVSLILFEPQHKKTLKFWANKDYNEKKNLRLGIGILLYVTAITVIIIEPVYIQSMLLISTGVNLFLWLPKQTKELVLPMSIFMGLIGFFFENFATGIIPSFSVWEYNIAAHNNLNIPDPIVGVAPISALIAYTGTGLILFSLTFILNTKLYQIS